MNNEIKITVSPASDADALEKAKAEEAKKVSEQAKKEETPVEPKTEVKNEEPKKEETPGEPKVEPTPEVPSSEPEVKEETPNASEVPASEPKNAEEPKKEETPAEPKAPEAKEFAIGNGSGKIECVGKGKFRVTVVMRKKDGTTKTVRFTCSKSRTIVYLILTFGVGVATGAVITWLLMK